MKKFLSRLIAGVVLAALAVCLTGCKGIVTERRLKSELEDALQEKYKEEFVCASIQPGKNVDGSYSGECYPVKDSELMFEARILTKDMTSRIDHYPTSIAAKEFAQMFDDKIGDTLGTHFTSCYESLGIYDEEEIQAVIDGTYSLEQYMTKRYSSNNYLDGVDHKLEKCFLILIDSSTLIDPLYDVEWDAINAALENIRKRGIDNGTDLCFRVWLYFVPHDTYVKGMEYKKTHLIGSTYLKGLAAGEERKFNRIIHFDVGLDIDPITKDEYLELRKNVD